MRHYAQTDTRRVGLGLNNGGWCPTCRGEAYFMAKWRGVAGNFASECKRCGERRLFVDTDLIGAINALIAHGGRVTRRAWTMPCGASGTPRHATFGKQGAWTSGWRW